MDKVVKRFNMLNAKEKYIPISLGGDMKKIAFTHKEEGIKKHEFTYCELIGYFLYLSGLH